MIKNRLAKLGIGAVLAIAGVVGFAQSASAETIVQIDHLSTPGDYGYIDGQIHWYSNSHVEINLAVEDISADGHGPYGHVIANADNGLPQIAHAHATGGNTSSQAMIGGTSSYGKIYWVDVWACNGGDINGNGTVEGGCYGRRYYDQYVYPGRGSYSLGNTTGGVY